MVDHWLRGMYGGGIVLSVIGLLEGETLGWVVGAALLGVGSVRRGRR
ncbi:MAG: hypothetical protein R3324_03380 [Halobacteriales archaeon]|nr:hypothetical protein [Halobacteriales archaeon]